MKIGTLLAMLFIGGVIYFLTDGGAMFDLGDPQQLPETIVAPDATFIGSEQSNPFTP